MRAAIIAENTAEAQAQELWVWFPTVLSIPTVRKCGPCYSIRVSAGRLLEPGAGRCWYHRGRFGTCRRFGTPGDGAGRRCSRSLAGAVGRTRNAGVYRHRRRMMAAGGHNVPYFATDCSVRVSWICWAFASIAFPLGVPNGRLSLRWGCTRPSERRKPLPPPRQPPRSIFASLKPKRITGQYELDP